MPASQAVEDGSVQITGLSISTLADSGNVVTANHLVILNGNFTNTTDTTIDRIEMKLVSTPAIKSRGELGQLLADPKSAKSLIASDKSAILRNITPGSTKQWQIAFRGEEVLGMNASGVYAFGVKPSLTETGAATVITTPWFFNATIKPTNVAFVIPLTTLNNHLANGKVTFGSAV